MRALVTFATGEHERLLALALPRFEAYAERHDYALIAEPPAMMLRPPSWMKLSALLDALASGYDAALWIDADVVIVDDSLDLADEVPDGAWQALVRHHTPDGEVPNCGVWYVRPDLRPYLEALWRMDRYLHHPWWEQAALLDLLGYSDDRPVVLERPTELYDRTFWLGREWNSHEERDRHPAPRFAHATAGSVDWRADVMGAYLAREVAPA